MSQMYMRVHAFVSPYIFLKKYWHKKGFVQNSSPKPIQQTGFCHRFPKKDSRSNHLVPRCSGWILERCGRARALLPVKKVGSLSDQAGADQGAQIAPFFGGFLLDIGPIWMVLEDP
jgi:hypothetical protein